jgi:hypothetical protein
MQDHEDDPRYDDQEGNQEIEITIFDDIHDDVPCRLKPKPARMFAKLQIIEQDMQVSPGHDNGGE